MGRILLTCASSVPACWLAAWWTEEADAELGLGWALQQQGLAILHDVSTHLGTEDNTSQVTDSGLLMNNNDYAYKTRHTLFQCHIIQFSEFPLSILLLEELYFITSLEDNYTHYPFIRELFVTPVALPPPSLLVCRLSLQVQRSRPALATSPARSQPDD